MGAGSSWHIFATSVVRAGAHTAPLLGGAPIQSIVERDIDIGDASLTHVERAIGTESGLLVDGPRWLINPALPPLLTKLSIRATEFCARLLEAAPTLTCTVTPPPRWVREPALVWKASDDDTEIPFDGLSTAQRRWSRFAVQLALATLQPELPILVVLDEPEAALHRRAERHLLSGLQWLIEELNAKMIVATHSPAFLVPSVGQLIHVRRQGPVATLERLPADLGGRLEELGLAPVDLLQLCRVVLLVEGQHELDVFGALFGDDLREAGAELLAMRGLKGLQASDAQLLFRFTEADVVVVMDNESTERLTDIWDRAVRAQCTGDEPLPILSEIRKIKTGEAKFIHDFAHSAITLKSPSRVRFVAMSEGDIIEYLPVEVLVRDAPSGTTWSDLRRQHRDADGRQDFKSWLGGRYDFSAEPETLRRAVQQLDHVPADLQQLLTVAMARRS